MLHRPTLHTALLFLSAVMPLVACGQTTRGDATGSRASTRDSSPDPRPVSSDAIPGPDPKAAWDLLHERHSGSPPFNTNRILIRATGEVIAVELCDESSGAEPCTLAMPGVMPSDKLRLTCRGGKRPLLKARAAATALASLGEAIHAAEFMALQDRYVVEMYDVGSFTLRVQYTNHPAKSIYYSPWQELDKQPAGQRTTAAMSSLLDNLESVDGKCVDADAAKAAIP